MTTVHKTSVDKDALTFHFERIHGAVGEGSQSVHWNEYLRYDGHPNGMRSYGSLRIDIKVDSHAFQSHARIDMHAHGEWCELASIHYSNMQSTAHPDEGAFCADRRALLDIARHLLV